MWDGHNHILHIWRLCHLFLSLSVISHQSANSQIRADLTLVALCLKLHRVVDVFFYKQTSTTQDIYHTRHQPHQTSVTLFLHTVWWMSIIYFTVLCGSVLSVCVCGLSEGSEESEGSEGFSRFIRTLYIQVSQ